MVNTKSLAKLQYYVPHRLLSRWVRWLSSLQIVWIKNFLIRLFISIYSVELNDCIITNINQFKNFNEFFTRKLKPETRPLAHCINGIICPTDGTISELGHQSSSDQIVTIKGCCYSLATLLGKENFQVSNHLVTYLAPKDYHRVHMPIDGTLRQMTYIPGRLFAVNPTSARAIPQLFSRNERVICIFDTPAGPLAIILVGAMMVGSISTIWHELVTPPPHQPSISFTKEYADQRIFLKQGDNMGHFEAGSTVILLFSNPSVTWQSNLNKGDYRQMGQLIGGWDD